MSVERKACVDCRYFLRDGYLAVCRKYELQVFDPVNGYTFGYPSTLRMASGSCGVEGLYWEAIPKNDKQQGLLTWLLSWTRS